MKGDLPPDVAAPLPPVAVAMAEPPPDTVQAEGWLVNLPAYAAAAGLAAVAAYFSVSGIFKSNPGDFAPTSRSRAVSRDSKSDLKARPVFLTLLDIAQAALVGKASHYETIPKSGLAPVSWRGEVLGRGYLG
jgi:hypothetical protein